MHRLQVHLARVKNFVILNIVKNPTRSGPSRSPVTHEERFSPVFHAPREHHRTWKIKYPFGGTRHAPLTVSAPNPLS